MRLILPLLAAVLVSGCIFKGKDKKASDTASGTASASPDAPLQYAPIARWDNYPFEDFPVTSYIPTNPVAVAYAMHGSNGGIGFCNKVETTAVLNELVLADIGFICTESTDRGTGKWDTSSPVSSNLDLQRLLRLHEQVISESALTADTPVVSLGFSNGGSMSTNVVEGFSEEGYRANAAAPHCSTGQAWDKDFPILFVIAVNDPQPEAESSSADLEASGIPTSVHHCPEIPLTPEFLQRDGVMSDGTAAKVVAEAERLGLIDAEGNRIFDLADAENWLKTYEREADVNSTTLHTEDFRVAFAMHRMNGMYAREVRDFFLNNK